MIKFSLLFLFFVSAFSFHFSRLSTTTKRVQRPLLLSKDQEINDLNLDQMFEVFEAADKEKKFEVMETENASSKAPTSSMEEKKSGFDVGLLIAFPLMLGTLFLFLFFPLLAPQFADVSTPPTI